ncbi:MAG: GAF and ANTAR domain-containing protein [Acidimicrobiales bacterium]
MSTRGNSGLAPTRISEIFVSLADTLVAEFDVVDFLTTLAHHSIEVLAADEAGVMLSDGNGGLRPVASSAHTNEILDLFEVQSTEGPGVDCYLSGEAILNRPIDASAPWERFRSRAERCGFQRVHALPMRLRSDRLGTVTVLSTSDTEIDQSASAVGQALADIATISLLQVRTMGEAQLVAEQLQIALTNRVIIEQAKGVLAERENLDMHAAFEMLRNYARSHRLKLAAVAHSVIDGSLDAAEIRTRG